MNKVVNPFNKYKTAKSCYYARCRRKKIDGQIYCPDHESKAMTAYTPSEFWLEEAVHDERVVEIFEKDVLASMLIHKNFEAYIEKYEEAYLEVSKPRLYIEIKTCYAFYIDSIYKAWQSGELI